MNLPSIAVSLPYITLALLVAALFTVRSRKIIAVVLAAQIFLAFIYEIINPLGLSAVAAFWAICVLHWRNVSSKEWLNTTWIFLIAAMAIGFASHSIPGFHNIRVFDGILISPHAVPFTMYLNFDKTIAAVILAMASGLLFKQTGSFGMKAARETVVISAFCISLLIPLAILSGYVNFEPKFPETFWLWAFNNLLFVCFAEEVIFRGLIQTHLIQMANRRQISPLIPIFISALLFAVALPGHYHGGPLLMAFATFAGVFYGYAYYRTNRLESAILVHFMVNVCHFLLFSYPMTARLGH